MIVFNVRFIVDASLGKLAKSLRMLGLDALYNKDYTAQIIASIASDENRIILTRQVAQLKFYIGRQAYELQSALVEDQIKEVIKRFDLLDQIHPFERCMECNGIIEPRLKEEVVDQLLPRTKESFNEFFQCPSCKRIYWKGSHYDRMELFIKQLKDSLS
jgi:uncharacterized protein with PIN domain